jgi:RHS repeat-associated protein
MRIVLASIFIICILWPLTLKAQSPHVIYVNKKTSGNGTSWSSAFTDLQSALTAAANLSGPKEIWIAQGEYRPSTIVDRGASFHVPDSTMIYGGFLGNETTKDQRNWKVNRTVLSGDHGVLFNSSDNSYHVVVIENSNGRGSGLDGVTIKGGNANGVPGAQHNDSGGGVLILGSAGINTAKIINCEFVENSAVQGGGLASVTDGSCSSCTVSPEITNCKFNGNRASQGGGVANIRAGGTSHPIYINCSFSSNSASNSGGALANLNCDASTINCTIASNQALVDGGGIFNNGASSPTIRNSILWNNFKGAFGPTLNTSQLFNASSTPIVQNNIIQGGYGATADNNISGDPKFEKAPSFVGLYPRTSVLPIQGTDTKYENLQMLSGVSNTRWWTYNAFKDIPYNKVYITGEKLSVIDYNTLTNGLPTSTLYNDFFWGRISRVEDGVHVASNKIYFATAASGLRAVDRMNGTITSVDILAGEPVTPNFVKVEDVVVDNDRNLLYAPIFYDPNNTFYGLLELDLVNNTKRWITNTSAPVSVPAVNNAGDVAYWNGHRVYLDHEADILYYAMGNGVWWWNRTTNATGVYNMNGGIPLQAGNSNLPSNLTTSMFIDHTSNKFYIGTHAGLFVWDRNNNTSRVYNSSNSVMPSNLVDYIDVNEEKSLIYVALELGGLFVLNTQTGEEHVFMKDEGNETFPQMIDSYPSSAHYDATEKKLYVATYQFNGGIWVRDYGNLVPDFGTLTLGAGSPAIDAADESFLPSGVSLDINGLSRLTNYLSIFGNKSLDIGAYERPYSAEDDIKEPEGEDQPNYVLTYLPQEEITDISTLEGTTVDMVNRKIEYFDGLGRPLQNISIQGSPSRLDIVQPFEYDEFGREGRKFLPYVAGSDGKYHANATSPSAGYVSSEQYQFYNQGSAVVAQDIAPFSRATYEPSPLKRVVKQGMIGAAWQPDGNNSFESSDKSIKTTIEVNDANEVLQLTFSPPNTTYPFGLVSSGTSSSPVYFQPGQLSKVREKDEDGNESIEYTDKEGKMVVKSMGVDNGYANTYYLYDDFNNLVAVIPPEAASRLISEYFSAGVTDDYRYEFLSRWAFRYRYDQRNRVVEKKVPGAESVYMIYDPLDRLVMTQDGNQRHKYPYEWTVTKYDALNRPIVTAVLTETYGWGISFAQDYVNGFYPVADNGSNGYLFYEERGTDLHGYTNRTYPNFLTEGECVNVTYYDDYDFRSSIRQPSNYNYQPNALTGISQIYNENVKGYVTGQKVKVLDGEAFTEVQWLVTLNYYDDKYRLIQTVRDNYKGGFDVTSNLVHSFNGRLLKTKLSHLNREATWQQFVNSGMAGKKVVKTAGVDQNWDASAVSQEVLPSGQSGWLEVTASEEWSYRAVGFAEQNPNGGVNALNYAFGLRGGEPKLVVLESGSTFVPTDPDDATFCFGDLLRIEKTGDQIVYKKNDKVIHTTTVTSDNDLRAASVFYSALSTVDYAKISFGNSTTTVDQGMEYDHMGRVLATKHAINGGGEIVISKNEFNAVGQLVDKKLHGSSSAAQDFKQSLDYRYNIQGWVTSINNAALATDGGITNDDTEDYYGMELVYNDISSGLSNSPHFNGRVSAMKWSNSQGKSATKEFAYIFQYDGLNRLLSATHMASNAPGIWSPGEFDEGGLTYDLNGNLLSLQRKGSGGAVIDNLSYNYGSGINRSNRLLSVGDGTTNGSDKRKGFVDSNTDGDDFSYDGNGNMTHNLNNGIGSSLDDLTNIITYNYLNLPQSVTKGGNSVHYVYSALGDKLQQYVTYRGTSRQVDYNGPLQYENNVLQFINHAEGRVVLASTKVIYVNSGGSVTDFTAVNSNLAIVTPTGGSGEDYVKVTSSGTTPRTGVFPINGTFYVSPGERYKIRVKGYRSKGTAAVSNPAYLLIKANTTDLDWPGASLPEGDAGQTESWIEQTVIIPPETNTLQVGLAWGTVSSGEEMFINEVEITALTTSDPEYQYNLKDHLGNVRLTFTTKQETDESLATLEPDNVNEERAKYLYYDEAVRINSRLFDHTDEETGTPEAPLPGSISIVKQAEEFAAQNGVTVSSGILTSCDEGDWVRYDGINLTGARSLKLQLSAPHGVGNIEVRVGSLTGTIVGILQGPNTGNSATFSGFTIPFAATSGSQAVFLLFKGGSGIANIDYIEFIGPPASGQPVKGISLNVDRLNLSIGQTGRLVKKLAPAEATDQNVTWNSSNVAIATVSASGVVTAVSVGTALITVTSADGLFTAKAVASIKPADGNLVRNPEFDQTTTQWTLFDNTGTDHTNGGTVLGSVTGAGLSGTNAAYIGVLNANNEIWTLQLRQSLNARIETGKTYEITFMGKSQTARTLNVALQGALMGTDYWNQSINLTTVSQTFGPFTFVCSDGRVNTEASFNLAFYLATGSNSDVWIDKVSVKDVSLGAAAPTGVSLSPAALALSIGQHGQLSSIIAPAEAMSDVTWTSSNNAVAIVNDKGLVTAAGTGTATITATTIAGNLAASSTVTVATAGTVTSINGEFDSGTTGWSFVNTTGGGAFSVVSGTGLSGTYALLVDVANTDNGGTTLAASNALPFRIESGRTYEISFMAKAQTARTATVAVNGITSATDYFSTTVNLTTTAQTFGPYQFACNNGNVQDEASFMLAFYFAKGIISDVWIDKVAVKDVTTGWSAATNLSISPSRLSLTAGQKGQLSKSITPSSASNQSIKWTSSDNRVASVDNNGVVTAFTTGSATITATSIDGNFSAQSVVDVNAGLTLYSTRLAGTPNERFGLARSLSVNPGDVINVEIWAKYLDNNSNNWTAALTNLMTNLAQGAGATGTLIDGGAAGSLGGGTLPFPATDHGDQVSTPPKAYLNYILFNKNMVPIPNGFASRQVTEDAREYGQDGPHERLAFDGTNQIVVKEPGYLYVYISNENDSPVDVFFDDFKVEHIKSPVISSQDYYPMGLTVNSYQRENSLTDKYQYNGKEKQDDLQVGWLDYGARMYSPDYGRWNSVDPKSEKYFNTTPYSFVLGNPISFIDPTGSEVFPVAGGYKYYGEDAKSVLSFLQNRPRKNVYIALVENQTIRDNTNRTIRDVSSQWNVFAAKDINQAAFMLRFIRDRSVRNLVFQGHGGVKGGENLFMTEIVPDVNHGNPNAAMTASRIENYISGNCDQSAESLDFMMRKVKNNGSMVFEFCFTGMGDGGDVILKTLFKLSGERLNIYASEGLVRHSLGMGVTKGELDMTQGIGIRGSLSGSDTNTQSGWKGIHPEGAGFKKGDIKSFKDLIAVDEPGKEPLILKP